MPRTTIQAVLHMYKSEFICILKYGRIAYLTTVLENKIYILPLVRCHFCKFYYWRYNLQYTYMQSIRHIFILRLTIGNRSLFWYCMVCMESFGTAWFAWKRLVLHGLHGSVWYCMVCMEAFGTAWFAWKRLE